MAGSCWNTDVSERRCRLPYSRFFFFAICYHTLIMGVLTPEIFLVSGEVLLSVKFSIDRSVFCLLVFRQDVSSPAPTSILHHGEYINKNFPELLTGCCAQAINFQT